MPRQFSCFGRIVPGTSPATWRPAPGQPDRFGRQLAAALAPTPPALAEPITRGEAILLLLALGGRGLTP